MLKRAALAAAIVVGLAIFGVLFVLALLDAGPFTAGNGVFTLGDEQ